MDVCMTVCVCVCVCVLSLTIMLGSEPGVDKKTGWSRDEDWGARAWAMVAQAHAQAHGNGRTSTTTEGTKMKGYFEHEKLEVYQAAIEFVVLADSLTCALPRGRAYLVDQLRRASTSIPLNIAEGAGESSGKEKARFYRMARRSATECAAAIDVCSRLHLCEPQAFEKTRELLVRVVAMLIRMTQVTEKRKSFCKSGGRADMRSGAE